MRFFNVLLLILFISSTVHAQSEDWLTEVMDKQQRIQQQMQQRGDFDAFNPERVQNDISSYLQEARAIAEGSEISQLEQQRIVNETFGNTAANIDVVETNIDSPTYGQVSDGTKANKTLSAIFVSFSMSDSELRQAFIAADEVGAEIYFNGMHENDQTFIDTMKRIHTVMSGSEARPRARFHPKAFTELDVTQVPMIFHAVPGNVAYATGTLNFSWLKQQMQGMRGITNFGLVGPSNEVAERNIIHELQERLGNIDMESRKRAAVENFWKKRDYVNIPEATETKTFYINPTVKVSKDIVNPNGDVLATKGQILNPLQTAPVKNAYYLFNASKPEHVEWALGLVDRTYTQGPQMFMTSQIDRENGWDHLSELRRRFNSELYLIPKELVERFKITGLPAIITTDLQKGLLKIQQINLQETPK